MTEEQLNKFMQALGKDYAKLNNAHLEIIQDYMGGYLNFETYKRKDLEYQARLETQKTVIDTFLKIKNQA